MDWLQVILNGVAAAAASLTIVYARSYVGERGKNRATKSDIAEITDLVKEVERRHAEQLARLTEELKAKTTMRFTAVEARLAAHQEAYGMAGAMLRNLYAPEADRNDIREQLAQFWSEKCLYLDEPARSAFDAAWSAFLRHPSLLEIGHRQPMEVVESNFKKLTDLMPAIASTAALPPIKLDADPATPQEGNDGSMPVLEPKVT
jgi:rubrerythrin